jgi:hypothetical protein
MESLGQSMFGIGVCLVRPYSTGNLYMTADYQGVVGGPNHVVGGNMINVIIVYFLIEF